MEARTYRAHSRQQPPNVIWLPIHSMNSQVSYAWETEAQRGQRGPWPPARASKRQSGSGQAGGESRDWEPKSPQWRHRHPSRPDPVAPTPPQVQAINVSSRFEEEIKAEQEERKKQAEEMKQRKAAFKELQSTFK